MAVQSIELSTILNRMKRWQALSRTEDQYLIRDLDEALRTNRREIQLPWTMQKSTLRVFNDVLEYPIPVGYDELTYLENNKANSFYPHTARFRFTSLQEFYENPDYRNDLAEIRDGNTTFLGVRYEDRNLVSKLLNNAEDVGDFSVSGDADSVAKDTVNFKVGNASMKVVVTNSADTATVKNTFDSFTEANYQRKYHFKWVYLDAVPTSITLRFQVDDSNYLETTGITTQFSGQALKADDWNLIAHDLNEATEVGTVSTASVWASEKVILLGAATGTYYVDESNLREWALMDFWYYSKYNVALVGSTTANQEYFYNSSDVYSTDSKLIADSEWVDVIMYDAMMTALADLKETETLNFIAAKRADAWNNLMETYPSLKPLIINQRWRFNENMNEQMYEDES